MIKSFIWHLFCGVPIATNMARLNIEGKLDIEGKDQTKVFYTYGSNLVILAWTGLELSHGQQVIDARTDRQTQASNDNIGWLYWPRVKKATT